MTQVLFQTARYEEPGLRPIICEMIDAIGADLIRKGTRVLIKPNLLMSAAPGKAITTHPLVVKAVAQYALDRGAKVQIADSPAIGSFQRILQEGGYLEALKGLDVAFHEFKASVKKDIGQPFGPIDLAEAVLAADVVVNLPKLKTHTQMLLTLGVKNMFGCVVGMKKPKWHFRSGVDREMFARLLVQIYAAINPSITLLDGILALEGQGPGRSGSPRQLGVLVGSANAAALDAAVCKMLGIDPERLPTHRAAQKRGLVGETLHIKGAFHMLEGFRLPELGPLVFGPKPLHGMIRRHLVQRPVADRRLCRLCGECWRYCPAQAIRQGRQKLDFDYDRCIRCYCCIEVCPHGALRAVETLPGRLLRLLPKLNS